MKNLFSICLLIVTTISYAQSPESFNYQAVIRDASNTILANQAVGIQFALLQGSPIGTAVYTESYSANTDTYGLVALAIGAGSSSDDFSAIDWSNGPYFLEIAADITGGTSYSFLGTQQLMSVPYALYAKKAGANAPSNQITDTDDDTKIQVEATADEDIIRLDVAGTQRMIINNNGEVGIGTGNPTTNLTVMSTVTTNVDIAHFSNSNNAKKASISLSNSGAGQMALLDENNNTDVLVSASANSYFNAANVGIGNTNPQEKLHVTGNIRMEDGTQGIGKVLTSDADGTATWTTMTTSTTLADADNDTKIQVEETADEDLIRFDIAGTEYFTMDAGRLNVLNTGNSVFIGEGAGLNDDLTSNKNSFIGYQAGQTNTTGNNNTATGYQALNKNTTGSHNTSTGNLALFNNTIGSLNTANGASALTSNTEGASNTANGASALTSNTTGFDNTANGANSLTLNTVGYQNVALGWGAGFNSSGNANVYLGYKAGYFETGSNKLYIANTNTSDPLIYGEFDTDLLRINGTLNINNEFSFPTTDGTTNQFLKTDGSGTLSWQNPYSSQITDTDNDTKIQVEKNEDDDAIRFDIAGTERIKIRANAGGNTMFETLNNDGNLFFGVNAGVNTVAVPDARNLFIGSHSGTATTTGENNIYLGYAAGFSNITGSNNVMIGNRAGTHETGSNKLYIENSASSSPLIYGEFDNDLLRINGTLNINVNEPYSFPIVAGTVNQILRTDGAGNLTWTDNTLGNHIATQNIVLNGNWLSGDGFNEGIKVDNNGNVQLGTSGDLLHSIVKVTVNADIPKIQKRRTKWVAFYVSNAQLGGIVYISPSAPLSNKIIIGQAYVSTVGTVMVAFKNTHLNNPVDPPAMDFYISVIN